MTDTYHGGKFTVKNNMFDNDAVYANLSSDR